MSTADESAPIQSDFVTKLIDEHPDALFVHDLQGKFVEVNKRACESLGYTRNQLLDMSFTDIEVEHQLSLPEVWDRVAESGPCTIGGAHRRSDGTVFFVEVRISAVSAGDQQLMIAAARPCDEPSDDSGRASAHIMELRVYREIFENANEAIAIIDHEGRYLRQNQAHQNLLGFLNDALVDKTPAIHLGPQVFQDVAAKLSDKGTYRGEHVSRSNEGTDVRIELSAFSVSQGPDRPPLYVGIKRNIDAREREFHERVDRERVALEESLRHAQKMELIGRLAAGVAHDFNNLLTPILAYSDLLLTMTDHPGGLDATSDDALQQIQQSAERGRSLTQQLLAFGRKQALKVKVLDLCDLVSDVATMLGRLVSEQIQIETNLADEVDPVNADPTAIEQILMNLATNAADAMPTGGRLSIRVSNLDVGSGDQLALILGEKGSFVELSVTDTGCGMDRDTLDRIFEPFFTKKRDNQGTGLGLSIVHGIVRQHDGFVHAESEVGKGTTFRVILPRSTKSLCVSESQPISSQDFAAGTILVAEDEPQVRSLVRDVLARLGYQILTACDGRDAIDVAAQHQGEIRLLLSDVIMPSMGGRELFEHLKKERPDLEVLFMSGYPRDGLTSGGRTQTAFSILEKPFSAGELTNRVNELMATGASELRS